MSAKRSGWRSAILGSLLLSITAVAQTPDAAAIAAAKRGFVDRMVKQHEFSRAELTATIDQAEINQTIIDTISLPA
jgi:membrane-bound lytic murein transglycosylase B